MRVLITGGTGFLGGALARRLKREGHDVLAMGRNEKAGARLRSDGIEFVRGELGDKALLLESSRGVEQLVHCAALAAPWGKYETFYEANVVGTRNVVDAIRENKIARLIYLSTPSLYFDYSHRLNIRETDPLPRIPATFYAGTKLEAEKVVDELAKEIPVISFRPRAIFGPGDQAVLPRMIRAGRNGKLPLIAGGRSYVDLTYVDNLLDLLVSSMTAGEQCFGKKYNVTNGEPVTSREMVEKLFSRLNMKVRFVPVPFRVAHAGARAMEKYYAWFKPKQEPPITRYAVGLMAFSQTLDISAARRDLGYLPKVSLDEGFDRFAHWWKGEAAAHR